MSVVTNNTVQIDPALAPLLQIMASEGINRATDSFARMVGVPLIATQPQSEAGPASPNCAVARRSGGRSRRYLFAGTWRIERPDNACDAL